MGIGTVHARAAASVSRLGGGRLQFLLLGHEYHLICSHKRLAGQALAWRKQGGFRKLAIVFRFVLALLIPPAGKCISKIEKNTEIPFL